MDVDRIPVVVAIDVEPDARQIRPGVRAPWTGFERLGPYLDGLRRSLSAATGSPVHWSWFFRVDEQVHVAYGSGGWALSHYAGEVDRARAAGDEIGLHVHAYRWDESAHSWIIDSADPSWVERGVRRAIGWFAETTGHPCRSFRFGDHWLDDRTVHVLEECGVRVDLTLEPGMPAMAAIAAGERHSGSLPDFTDVPAHPYRASRTDYRVADPERTDGLWMLPVTTGRLPRGVVPIQSVYRWIRRQRGATLEIVTLNPTLLPVLFRSIATPLLRSEHPGCLVLPLRSDGGLSPRVSRRIATNLEFLVRASGGRVVFTTPEEALELWRVASHAGT